MRTFRIGGVHPEENKLSAEVATTAAALPKQAVFPLSQHIGAPAKPIVAKGDKVKAGTMIAEAGGFVSAPVFSSISGTVLKIDNVVDATGYAKPAIIITSDGEDNWEESIDRSETLETLEAHPELTPEEIVERVKRAGVTGMGGAGFPTHVKLCPPPGAKATCVIINGVECEPYITSDYRLMMEHADEIIEGVKLLMKAVKVNEGYIGIEDNKPKAIALFEQKLQNTPSIQVVALAKKYFALAKSVKPRHHLDIWAYYQLYNEAHILNAEHRYAEAIEKHEQARQYAADQQMGSVYQLYQDSEIGLIYLNSHFYNQAISIAEQCTLQAKRLNSRELLANAYKILAEAYLGKGDEYESERYRSMYSLLSDSVYNMSRFYQLRSKLADYEERKYNEHISGLTNTINRQWITLNIVIVVLLLVVLGFVITMYRRQKQETSKLWANTHQQGGSNEVPAPPAEKCPQSVNQRQHDAATPEVTPEKAPTPTLQLTKEQFELLRTRIADVMGDTDVVFRPDFSIQLLSDMVRSNTRYVSYVLNETHHKNFNSLLNDIRIHEAARRLADTEHYGNMTIQGIYGELGYTNAMTFNRAFKKIMGITPSKYQQSCRDTQKS